MTSKEVQVQQQDVTKDAPLVDFSQNFQEPRIDKQEPDLMQNFQKPMNVKGNENEKGNVAQTGHNGPHVAMEIGNKIHVAVLLDTGADIGGLMSTSILNKHNIKHTVLPTSTKVKGVGGKNMGVIGESVIEATINGLAKNIKFILVEEDGFCLVGLPTLKSFKIQINTDEETIICNNTLTNYFKKTGIMGSEVKVNLVSREECNVHLDSTITIPANKSMLVFANVKGMEHVKKDTLLEVDGSYAATRYGVLIPRSVVSKDEKIPILIKNWYNSDVKLYKSCSIGKASVAKIKENDLIMDLKPEDEVDTSPDMHPIDKINLEHLDEEKRKKVEQMLLRRHKAFSRGENDLGHSNLIKHKIDVENEDEIRAGPPRNYSKAKQEAMTEHIEKMLDQGVIEETNKAIKSHPVLTYKIIDNKKVENKRFAMDLRAVNQLTKTTTYLLPKIEDIITSLSGKKYFSKLDGQSAFHQIELEEDSKKYTAFQVPNGLTYWFVRMPFGASGASYTQQRLMNMVFHGLTPTMVSCFVDDTIISSMMFDDHLEEVDICLKRLENEMQ